MKMKVEEIIRYRGKNEKCYLILDSEDKFLVIYGTRYRELTYNDGDLYRTVKSFISEDNTREWKFVVAIIVDDRDKGISSNSNSKWLFLTDIKDKSIEVNSVYVDGEKSI